MSGRPPHPMPSVLLEAALEGRIPDVRRRLIERLTREDVRELARAIDETVMSEVVSNVSRMEKFGEGQRAKLSALLDERWGVVRHG